MLVTVRHSQLETSTFSAQLQPVTHTLLVQLESWIIRRQDYSKKPRAALCDRFRDCRTAAGGTHCHRWPLLGNDSAEVNRSLHHRIEISPS
jgi:hypothetical protein